MKKLLLTILVLGASLTSKGHSDASIEDEYWNDFKRSGQKIVPYVKSIAEFNPKAATWFLTKGGKYGFSKRKATPTEAKLMVDAVVIIQKNRLGKLRSKNNKEDLLDTFKTLWERNPISELENVRSLYKHASMKVYNDFSPALQIPTIERSLRVQIPYKIVLNNLWYYKYLMDIEKKRRIRGFSTKYDLIMSGEELEELLIASTRYPCSRVKHSCNLSTLD